MALFHHPEQKHQWPTFKHMVFTTNTHPCSCAPKITFIIQICIQQPVAFFLWIWLHHNIYFTKLYMRIVFNTCFSCFYFCILTTIILPKVCLNVCDCVWVCVCECVCVKSIMTYNFWGLISLNILLWSIHFAVITFVYSFLTAP